MWPVWPVWPVWPMWPGRPNHRVQSNACEIQLVLPWPSAASVGSPPASALAAAVLELELEVLPPPAER